MNNDFKNELNKIYKLTGIKLRIENEDEIDLIDLKKLSTAYKEKYSSANLLLNIPCSDALQGNRVYRTPWQSMFFHLHSPKLFWSLHLSSNL